MVCTDSRIGRTVVIHEDSNVSDLCNRAVISQGTRKQTRKCSVSSDKTRGVREFSVIVELSGNQFKFVAVLVNPSGTTTRSSVCLVREVVGIVGIVPCRVSKVICTPDVIPDAGERSIVEGVERIVSSLLIVRYGSANLSYLNLQV